MIQYNYSSSIENVLFDIIYSFHMPLFFFVSGCTRALNVNIVSSVTGLIKIILKKFCLLIIPSIIWTLFVPFFFVKDYAFICNSISGYWFLNVLFVVVTFWETFSFLLYKIKIRFLLYIIVFGGILVLFILGIKRISLFYLMMYVLGFYFQKYAFLYKIHNYIYMALFLAFCICSPYFDYGNTTLGNPDRIWLLIPLSICASFSLMRIFACCEINYKSQLSFLGFIGNYTLGIYLSHFIFVKLPFVTYWETGVNMGIQFIILLLIALCISFICIGIERLIVFYPELHRLMYGRNYK